VYSVVVLTKDGLSERGARLLELAASRGWIFAPARRRLFARARRTPFRDLGVALPREWRVPAPGRRLVPCDGEIDLAGAADLAACGKLLVLRNGRWTVEVDEDLLRAAIGNWPADVVAVTVTRDERAYREKLVAARDGKVLGFRRLYRDVAAPCAMPAAWPHILALKRAGLDFVARRPVVSASFSEFAREACAEGLEVGSIAVGGLAWDVSSDEGLSIVWRRRPEPGRAGRTRVSGDLSGVSPRARLEGEVFVEGGATVRDAAVILGPAFIGTSASVGEGAVVRSSIIGPGAEVPAGNVVRNAIVLAGDAAGAGPPRGGPQPHARAARSGNAFRWWPFFSYARLGKRVLDVIGSIIALAFLLTIFPIVAAAIKLNSRGPVFYRHKRQGRHGRQFGCLKFRTMVAGAETTEDELRAVNEVDGPQFKIENDPRITIVGEFLRATNMDEIPQFLNVLAGRMSIVGPRPSPDNENQMCPSWREARLSVRPGITGLWQVSRSKERTNDFQEWIYYDTEYVRTLSFWNDLVIMARTVVVILSGFARLFVARREG